MDRRKFLTYVGCTCCSLALNSCATAPITDRKQLKLIPEAKLNARAAQIFEKIKESTLYKNKRIYKLLVPIDEKMFFPRKNNNFSV